MTVSTDVIRVGGPSVLGPSPFERREALEAVVRIRDRAEVKLAAQAARATRYTNYYEDRQPVPSMLSSSQRRVFRALMAQARENWCELVVNAVAERSWYWWRLVADAVALGVEEGQLLCLKIGEPGQVSQPHFGAAGDRVLAAVVLVVVERT